jgi:hypothetical protein
MKTTSQTTRSFPKPVKFSIYVCAVAVLCFFNWVAIQAEGPAKSLENSLVAALVEEVEAEIEVESWMLTFSNDYIADREPEIEIEPWMLTFADDCLTTMETEIEVESWMLTFADDYMANSETDLSVEDWMTNTFLWDTAYMLARK